MNNLDEVKRIQELSTKAEKRNSRILASLFTGDKRIAYLEGNAPLTARQRQAFVDALLRSRRLWKPSQSELAISAASDYQFLSERGAPKLAQASLDRAIKIAMDEESFELVLHIIASTTQPNLFQEPYHSARSALAEINELEDLIYHVRSCGQGDSNRNETLGMLVKAPTLLRVPKSRRARYLQAKCLMMIDIYLEKFESALKQVSILREFPISNIEMLNTIFQTAQLHCILGDYNAAESCLTTLWAIDSKGVEFDSVKLVEWLILKLSIALDLGDHNLGVRALNMLEAHLDFDTVSSIVPQNRFTMAITHALQFAVEHSLHDQALWLWEVADRYVPSSSPNKFWCILNQLVYCFLLDEFDEMESLLRKLKRMGPSALGGVVIQLIQDSTRYKTDQDRHFSKIIEAWDQLPIRERSRLNIPRLIAKKRREDQWLPGDFLQIAAQ